MWRKGANGAGKRLRIPAGRGGGTAAGGVRYPGDSANRGHDEDGGGSARTVWRSGRSSWYRRCVPADPENVGSGYGWYAGRRVCTRDWMG